VWLVVLILGASWGINKDIISVGYFGFLLSFMLVTLMLTFRVANFLGLYIFFEASLIPTLLVIIGWGYQTERLQAGVYFLFYTMTSSLPLLVIILLNYQWYSCLEVNNRVIEGLGGKGETLELFKLIIITRAFLVKIPLFFVHL
jgi:NADH-ubiquinone oxidoreductase chain 4